VVNRRSSRVRGAAFTLIELLAVIVIVSIVSVVTLAAYRALASDSRHSVAANTISIALDNARAIAIERGKRTMVVFRSVRTGVQSQQIEVLIATETRDVHVNPWAEYETAYDYQYNQPEDQMGLRFEPVDGVKPRMLPEGMMVAAPVYSMSGISNQFDEEELFEQDVWMSQSNLGQIRGRSDDEAPGVILGILFETDGSMRPSFTDTGSSLAFVDFNGDGAQRVLDPTSNLQNPYRDWCLTSTCRPPTTGTMVPGVPEPGADYVTELGLDSEEGVAQLLYYGQDRDESEPYVMVAPFFVVYDYAEANAFYGGDLPDPDSGDRLWSNPTVRLQQLDEFAKAYGHVYHFNKYSGIVAK